MEDKLKELKRHLLEINDIEAAVAVLRWDQSTYMPSGGAPGRGRQLATLARLAQEKSTSTTIGKLLDELETYIEGLPEDSDDARLVKVARRNFDRATRVPPAFIGEFYAHLALSNQAWIKARPESDFAAVEPYLEKTRDFSLKYATFFPEYEHPADAWIDQFDYGMKAQTVREVFSGLRHALVPLVQAITTQEPAEDGFIKFHYPHDSQLEFADSVIQDFGYDFDRGRNDLTHHPFTIRFYKDDVRITTRVDEHNLNEAMFSTFHEAGHAFYELSINPEFDGTPLGNGTSSGVHESSSRLWENIIGRSLGFWEGYYPKLVAVFPEQLKDVSLEAFYRAINKVQPSLIRTDADEVTYNLHVMIRFDLELAMLEGRLAVKDLPDAWHARYESDLGVRAPDDTDGCLQDIHWYFGPIGGMFQGYTLGNILSSTFYNAALKAHPEIPEEIRQGKFHTLHTWLAENVYYFGSKYTTRELVERITGGPLTIDPYIQYLKTKFGALYSL